MEWKGRTGNEMPHGNRCKWEWTEWNGTMNGMKGMERSWDDMLKFTGVCMWSRLNEVPASHYYPQEEKQNSKIEKHVDQTGEPHVQAKTKKPSSHHHPPVRKINRRRDP